MKYLNKGIDDTRKQEVKTEPLLKKAKYVMLKKSPNLSEKQRARFEEINQANLDTAKAWRMRENFMALYDCTTVEEASAYFDRWIENVMHSTIEPMKKIAKTLRSFKTGIINAVQYRLTNAIAEGMNNQIQRLKTVAQGYRNFDNLKTAILFFNGKLSLLSQY